MYIVGADHPNKWAAEAALRRLGLENRRLVTDAEVLQEILHRYSSLNRRGAIQDAFDVLLGWADEVYPVDLPVVESAKSTLLAYRDLTARDALHLAVMKQQGIHEILSFDQGFDLVPGVTRLTS